MLLSRFFDFKIVYFRHYISSFYLLSLYILISFEGFLCFGQCCKRVNIIVLMLLRSNTFSFIILAITLFSLSLVTVIRKIDSGATGESRAGDTLYSNNIIVYEEPLYYLLFYHWHCYENKKSTIKVLLRRKSRWSLGVLVMASPRRVSLVPRGPCYGSLLYLITGHLQGQ